MNITLQSNAVFAPVHKSRHRYVVMKGSAGSGKSVDTAQQYILRLMSEPGRNLVCMRKSDVTNRDSTYAELMGAINRMGVGKIFRATLSPLAITCANGNSALFRGMNDVKQREKLKSINFPRGKLTDIWLEEATEFTQDDVEIIDDRLRGELPPGLFYQMKLTFNPVNTNHWVKRVYYDTISTDVLTNQSTYKDNRFIDAAYYRRMERRRLLDPAGYRIYGEGDWGEEGGLILTNWQAAEMSQNLSDYHAVALGQDFGYNHANAILLLGEKDGDIYILMEIYVHELDTSEIIPLGLKAELPRRKTMYCDSAEPDRIKMWQRAGFRAIPVVKERGCERACIDWLKQRRIYVHPSCVNTIRELGQWKWRKDETSNTYMDEPVGYMDDAMAALRYGVEGWRKPSGWIH